MKKIKILKSLVEISIIGLVSMFVFVVFKLNPWVGKFNEFAENMPQNRDFDHIRMLMRFLPILASFKIVIPVFFFITILILLRKVLISVLKDAAFSIKQVVLIKKMARIYLIFTTILFSFNLLIGISAMLKGKNEVVLKIIASTLISSLSYLITSLIAYIIAEIFLTGFKLREEAEFTV